MLKIKDILDKKVKYSINCGDEYYWEYKLIVEIDDNNYCLINYDDSYSGYIEFNMESVSPEFISAFFYPRYFNKDGRLLKKYVEGRENYDCLNHEAILIPKKEANKYLVEKVDDK